MPKISKLHAYIFFIVLNFNWLMSAHALHPMGRDDTHESLEAYGRNFDPIDRDLMENMGCSGVKVGETDKHDVYLTAAHCFIRFRGITPDDNLLKYIEHFEIHPSYKDYPELQAYSPAYNLGKTFSLTSFSFYGFTQGLALAAGFISLKNIYTYGIKEGLKSLAFATGLYLLSDSLISSFQEDETSGEPKRYRGHVHLYTRFDQAIMFTKKTNIKIHPILWGDYSTLFSQDSTNATVVGYGRTFYNEFATTGNPLFSLKPRIVGSRQTQAADVEVTYLERTETFVHMCRPMSHNDKPYASTTPGDSGGPLLWQNPEGTYHVIGITAESFTEHLKPALHYKELGIAKRHASLDDLKKNKNENYLVEGSNINSYFKEMHEVCANIYHADLLGDGMECYGTMQAWPALDLDFIRRIFNKYNVTTN